MSLWSRFVNVWRADRVVREIDQELESHIAEAIEQGRDPAEARRAFGSTLLAGEKSRDLRMVPLLDALRADAVFGWRQLMKRKVTSAAAILSLALAIGACTSAFRLIEALLLRPLPIVHPERLYVFAQEGIGPAGNFRVTESCEYPLFRQMHAAAKGQAELMAISYADRADLTFGSDEDTEKAWRQYISGWTFNAFGLTPVLGRLFSRTDDLTPRAHPVAVLSWDYWTHRFGRDPRVIGRTFRMGGDLYQIIGVAPEAFTGTEPGTITDIFLPAMMHPGVLHDDWAWIRTFVLLRANVAPEAVRDRLSGVFHAVENERAKGFRGGPASRLAHFLQQNAVLEPAAGGASEMRRDYRLALTVLAVLVGLVLLITCANLANLLTAQAAARVREMALRVSIGAGRRRLIQLVLVESALLALLAVPIAGLIASWSAPFVLSRINPADNPARLVLPSDWRVAGFALALAVAVTFLFGLIPALRASAVNPANALRGGENHHSRRRLMHALIAVQVAFCFVVLFIAGLFIATFDRLSSQPTGFSADRLLAVDAVAKPSQPSIFWEQVATQLRRQSGIESVALAAWPLMSNNGSNGFVSVNGTPASDVLAYFLNVSPGWLETMKIPLIDGRDFRPNDISPGAAIVNEAFAKEYFRDVNPIGKWFDRTNSARFQVVGLVRNARYRNMREPITPTAYIPFRHAGPESVQSATFLVRTASSNPLTMASMLRGEIPRVRPEFHVSNIRTQLELNRSQTVRERLLAALALFFAVVALFLAGIGLYGVLDYSVLQRRREIGIRMAVGAPAGDIAWRVTADVFSMVAVGAAVGLIAGIVSARSLEALLYHVKATELDVLAGPSLSIVCVALLASVPAIIRAVRIDPVAMLRVE